MQIEKHIVCLSIFCALNCAFGSQQEISKTDPNILATKIEEITETSLKCREMQNHLDTLTYIRKPLNGTSLLEKLSSSLTAKFQSRVAMVTHLRNAVIRSYKGTTSGTKQCCKLSLSELEYDMRFKKPVSPTTVCELVSSSAAYNPVKLQNAFRDACVENLRNVPSLKWQYFGSEQGVTTTFPATKANDCGSYDNRFRPWYVQSSVPQGKQIVIVIDKSGSMWTRYNGVTYMEFARQAAKTVIDSLNPYDEFAVVAFASVASVYTNYQVQNGRCFSNTFAQATPQNKKLVKNYISTIAAGGGTAYVNALNAAFTFFDNAENNTQANRAILFLSDGAPNDPSYSILATLNRRNSALNNSVALLTYSLGGSVDGIVLGQMAQSTSVKVGSVNKTGVYTPISTPSNLRNQMASYYEFFSDPGRTTDIPNWTVPYLDSWGLGLITTANLPVHIGGRLVGVAAADVTIEELLAESSYFKPTELSYSFVINEGGHVINHPNFPYVTDREPLFVEATAFERDQEFISVFQSMKSGGSGNKSFVSTRILPAGDGKMYGGRQLKVKSTYYWKQIPGTKFSVCLVLADEDAQTVLASQGSLASGTFLYHRFDLVPPTKQCYHRRRICAKNESSVVLAARSFKDPELYLTQNTSVSYVRALANYMEGKSLNHANTKRGVKDAVVATYKADELWKAAESDELNRQVFWRYVATKEGLFRIFPGTQMPSNYDPVRRAWYQKAQANRGKYVITPPYRDEASNGSFVTLSKALFEGKNDGVHDPTSDKLIGAMGTDIVTSYFQQVISELYPICNQTSLYKCILIDNAGFVITAQQFVTNPNDAFNKHIASLEPEIAHRLQTSNVLLPKKCANIENAMVYETFEISPNQTRFGSSTGYPTCQYFELMPVNGTNSYLIIASKQGGSCGTRSPLACGCSSVGSSKNICSDYYPCSCPCSSYSQVYDPCTNKYLFTNNSPQPCTPEIKDLTQLEAPLVDLSTLDMCYDTSFSVPLSTEAYKIESTTVGGGGSEGGVWNLPALGTILGGVFGILLLVIVILILKPGI